MQTSWWPLSDLTSPRENLTSPHLPGFVWCGGLKAHWSYQRYVLLPLYGRPLPASGEMMAQSSQMRFDMAVQSYGTSSLCWVKLVFVFFLETSCPWKGTPVSKSKFAIDVQSIIRGPLPQSRKTPCNFTTWTFVRRILIKLETSWIQKFSLIILKSCED